MKQDRERCPERQRQGSKNNIPSEKEIAMAIQV